MFGSATYGANAYAKVGIESDIASASPHRLIILLYEGAIKSISSASSMMKSGDFAGKGQAISKAISIINEGLRASLDRKAGKDIADNLEALYEYMSRRLFEAHVNNDAQILQEIQSLLQDLKGAWDEIGSRTADVLPIEKKAPAPAYDPLEPRLSRLVRA